MSTTPEPHTEPAAGARQARIAARAFRERKRKQRAAQRRQLVNMTSAPVTAEQRAYDPLDHGAFGGALTAVLVGGLVLGAVLLHGAVLAAFLGVGMLITEPGPAKDEAIEVAIVETKPPEPEPPKPPPEPEPEPEVEEPEIETPEPPPPEPEPEPEPPKPKPKPKPKQPPPPPPPDPINEPEEPPKDPPKEEPRRIVGLNMESTVTGGKGPSFATGNTRMGTTDDKAEDPNKVDKIPPGAKGGKPGAKSGNPNKVATRIPTKGVSYTKPKYKGGRLRPPYPEILRRRNVEDNVVVLVTIDKEGVVTAVNLVKPSKYPELNAAAERTAKRQRFVPATKNGEPIGYRLKYTYRFRLNN